MGLPVGKEAGMKRFFSDGPGFMAIGLILGTITYLAVYKIAAYAII